MTEGKNEFVKALDPIYFEGSTANYLYIIKSGAVINVKKCEKRLIPVSFNVSKDILGEESIFNHFKYFSTAIALEDTQLIKISLSDISNQISKCNDWVEKILSLLSKRVCHATEILVEHKIIGPKLFDGKEFDSKLETKLIKIIEEHEVNGQT